MKQFSTEQIHCYMHYVTFKQFPILIIYIWAYVWSSKLYYAKLQNPTHTWWRAMEYHWIILEKYLWKSRRNDWNIVLTNHETWLHIYIKERRRLQSTGTFHKYQRQKTLARMFIIGQRKEETQTKYKLCCDARSPVS